LITVDAHPVQGEPSRIKPDASTGTVVTELPDQKLEKQPVENNSFEVGFVLF
jgi:hypothetical protein